MTPSDIANRSLDALGITNTIGDLEEGTDQAKVLLRQYSPALREISRGAHWNCLRKKGALTLLQDATGQTTQQQQNNGQPITVGTGTVGMRPWIYEYAWLVDCLKVRFVPRSYPGENPPIPTGNITRPTTPLYTGQANIILARETPTRFLVTNDVIPNLVGAPASWTDIPDTSGIMGQGITSQTVILTNHQCATAVYTALITYPDLWDPLFQNAVVALLAVRSALALIPDKKLAMELRAQQIAIAKGALDQARVSDGQEGVHSTDITPDWLRIRNTVGGGWGEPGWGGSFGGLGVTGYGWDTVNFGGNDSAY